MRKHLNAQKTAFALILCIAVSATGIAGWTKKESGTLAWLNSVYFLDEERGWIAGSYGTLLTTNDGGDSWKSEKRFTKDNIRDVFFVDEKIGWLLCERDFFNAGREPLTYLMKTADGGLTWDNVALGRGNERLSRIFFAKDKKGYAVGESGALWRMQSNADAWGRSQLPVRYLIRGGAFFSDGKGILVGGGGTILFTEDGGRSWNPAPVFGSDDIPKLNAVYFFDEKTGWTAGSRGKIYASQDGGRTWHEQASGVSEDLSDIAFVSPVDGFAVGSNGMMLQTMNGKTWRAEKAATKNKLERVVFTAKRGFAVGFGGLILQIDRIRDARKEVF